MYHLGFPTKSILKRALVLYAEQDDFGTLPNDKYSYYFGSNIEAIACCNITPFKIRELQTGDETAPSNDERTRGLQDEEVEIMTLEEYNQVFGVEYDPADWSLEAFTQ